MLELVLKGLVKLRMKKFGNVYWHSSRIFLLWNTKDVLKTVFVHAIKANGVQNNTWINSLSLELDFFFCVLQRKVRGLELYVVTENKTFPK